MRGHVLKYNGEWGVRKNTADAFKFSNEKTNFQAVATLSTQGLLG